MPLLLSIAQIRRKGRLLALLPGVRLLRTQVHRHLISARLPAFDVESILDAGLRGTDEALGGMCSSVGRELEVHIDHKLKAFAVVVHVGVDTAEAAHLHGALRGLNLVQIAPEDLGACPGWRLLGQRGARNGERQCSADEGALQRAGKGGKTDGDA